MRRVLVPLDGSVFAESIIPDARRLAGPDGELILVRDARLPLLDRDIFVDSTMLAVEDAEWYLHHEVEKLREEGVKSRSQSLLLADAASAIDEAARIFNADMIAVATHGRGPFSRLLRGSVAWRAVANSPVPILLRHVDDDAELTPAQEGDRRILVPLDGSSYGEKALPLAQELAQEWNATLWLARIVPEIAIPAQPYAGVTPVMVIDKDAVNEARDYLQRVADRLPGTVHVEVAHIPIELGRIADALAGDIKRLSITDVVMASHGRTGLSRVILGSVADELIHRVRCSVIVVPALEAEQLEELTGPSMEMTAAAESHDQSAVAR